MKLLQVEDLCLIFFFLIKLLNNTKVNQEKKEREREREKEKASISIVNSLSIQMWWDHIDGGFETGLDQ